MAQARPKTEKYVIATDASGAQRRDAEYRDRDLELEMGTLEDSDVCTGRNEPAPTRAASGLMTVAEVLRRTGITRKALLVYERLGLVRPAQRTEAGYRLYDDVALRRLGLVTRAKALGLTLAEADEFIDAADRCCRQNQPDLTALLERKLAEVEARLEELEVLRSTLQGVLAGSPQNGGPTRCEGTLCAWAVPPSPSLGQRHTAAAVASPAR